MTEAIALFLGLTVALAAIFVLALATVVSAWRHRERSGVAPAIALVPVTAPYAAWLAGSRALPIALGIATITYVVLQIWAHAR